MNILITHPDFKDSGGVSNYYKHLQGKFTVPVKHFIIAKRPKEKGLLLRFLRLFADYFRFAKCLRKNQIDLVHINPSLDLKSFIRDGAFALIARAYNKKVLIFFHGWQKPFEIQIEHRFLWLFRLLYGNSSAFIVLCNQFKETLERWGVVKPIYREVTTIDENNLNDFDMQTVLKKRHEFDKYRILFLSRIIKRKGIYETVQAIYSLQRKYPNIELIIAGDGPELENVKLLVQSHKMQNVTFLGYVRDQEKRHIFEVSQIFCFPTYYDEGLPCAVIEAIAYGLPIVTRSVGGLADFFKDEQHGFLLDSLDPNVLAGLIEKLIVDKKLYDRIALFNYQFAQSHFLARNSAQRLELIYKRVLND
jgi:glycosyltransferase involved in cell wall biosynthesis